MTLGQLEKEVCALGFENAIDNRNDLLICANRALLQIAGEHPSESTFSLLQEGGHLSLSLPFLQHLPGETLSFSLPDGGYSFRVRGKGTFRVSEQEVRFDTDNLLYRGCCHAGDLLTFCGDDTFAVFGLCLFDTVFSSDEQVPTAADTVRYDLRALCPDFFGFCGRVTDSFGKPIPGASLRDGTLCLPTPYRGEARVPYRRRPQTITGTGEGESIDVPAEAEPLLPLLTASYLWLDDDAEKSQFYLALYRDAMNRLIAGDPRTVEPAYDDVLSWA